MTPTQSITLAAGLALIATGLSIPESNGTRVVDLPAAATTSTIAAAAPAAKELK